MKIVIDVPNEDANVFFNYLDLKYSTEASYLPVRSIQMFNTRGRLVKEAYVRPNERRNVEQAIRNAEILNHLEKAFRRTDET